MGILTPVLLGALGEEFRPLAHFDAGFLWLLINL